MLRHVVLQLSLRTGRLHLGWLVFLLSFSHYFIASAKKVL